MRRQYNFDFFDYDFPVALSYDKAKELYENTKPLRGKLRSRDLNLRPIGRRRYSGNAYIEEGDKCYTIRFTYEFSRWGMRFKKSPDYAADKPFWGTLYDTTIKFYRNKIVITPGSKMCVESNALLSAVLPDCVRLVRINSKMYLETNRGFFWLAPTRDLILRPKEDGWQVTNPVREIVIKLTDAYRKKLEKQFTDFFGWAEKMWPFVEPNAHDLSSWTIRFHRLSTLEKSVAVLELCKAAAFTERYNHDIHKYERHLLSFTEWKKRDKLSLRRMLYKQALRDKRTTRVVRIPLGTPAPRLGY